MLRELCEYLEWDSHFFGIPVGRIKGNRLENDGIQRVLLWCKERQIRCLYFLCAPDHDESVRLAEQSLFHLVDIRVELIQNISKNHQTMPPDGGQIRVRPFRMEDKIELVTIAENTYRDTRFFYDSHFDQGLASALYSEWLSKSCSGFADAVLVAESQNAVVGYVTCHVDSSKSGRIGLVGVKRNVQGKGIGSLLVNSARTYFVQHDIHEVSIATQGRNVAAQRLYQRCGFVSSKVYLWYHRWFDSGNLP